MKPRVLILMHYMELGGAESALLGLLQSVDPNRAEVDVFIYSHRGELMNYIPTDKVRVLPEIEAYSLTEKPMSEVVKKGYWRLAIARMKGRQQTSSFIKKHQDSDKSAECGTFFQQRATWKVLPKIQPDVEYDLAISFLTPYFFVLNNVRAKKKIGWIHTDYTRILIDAEAELEMWQRLDYIASISEEVGNRFCEVFPSLKPKLIQIENILNSEFIRKRSGEFIPTDLLRRENVVNILSIGRYTNAKRFDEVGSICRKVRENLSQMDFSRDIHWYIIGYGGDEHLIRQNIVKEGMENWVTILGKRSNPYPYIKECDIYAQPSRFEGKSITVREAQILCKPVVVTSYPTAHSQIINGVDGMIVPNELDECARGIAEFIVNLQKQNELIAYLQEHDYGNENEVNKIYQLLK